MSVLSDKVMRAYLAQERGQNTNAAQAQKRIEARKAKKFLDQHPTIARINVMPSAVKTPVQKGHAKSSLDLMDRFPGLKNIKKAN